MNKFAERLKELREEKGLSQNELAKQLNSKTTHAAISFWELGRSLPRFDTAIMLANFFGVSIDYLIGLED